jgi:hypothetical protein
MWDDPTMIVKVDSKKRVVLPGAKPGDVMAYEDQGGGHFLLMRLNLPPPPKKMTRAEVQQAIKSSKLQPTMHWEELRHWTREP